MVASPIGPGAPAHAGAPDHEAVPAPPPDVDQRVILHGVTWEQYEAMRAAVDEPGVRMTYTQGALEIMAPSRKHEDVKTRIARLLELFALERDIPLYGYGSMTFRHELEKHGLEPDECYGVGADMREVPDLALEVVVTRGGIDKRVIYRALGVRELWTWRDGAITVEVLTEGGYERRTGSEVIPSIDLDELARLAAEPDQHATLRAFRDRLRAG